MIRIYTIWINVVPYMILTVLTLVWTVTGYQQVLSFTSSAVKFEAKVCFKCTNDKWVSKLIKQSKHQKNFGLIGVSIRNQWMTALTFHDGFTILFVALPGKLVMPSIITLSSLNPSLGPPILKLIFTTHSKYVSGTCPVKALPLIYIHFIFY